MPAVSDCTAAIDTLPVFWHEAAVPGAGEGAATPLYLHGVPTCADDWLGFLERTGGLAPDLPGFGRTGKAANLDYTIDGYADFIERYLDLVGVERVSLVMHDWGSVGLAYAQRHPERIARLALIDAIPLLPGYRWHRTARLWRTPLLGELAMGTTTRRVLRYATREARPGREPMPEEWLDTVLDHFDQGTQRAILRLYRSSPPDVLASAGARLGALSMPALVLWGRADPYIPVQFARAYAKAIGGPAHPAELIELPGAGHWPWLDTPGAIDTVVDFLRAGADTGTGADSDSGGFESSGPDASSGSEVGAETDTEAGSEAGAEAGTGSTADAGADLG